MQAREEGLKQQKPCLTLKREKGITSVFCDYKQLITDF